MENVNIKCPKCGQSKDHKLLSLLHEDLAFYSCPNKKCRYISGHNGKQFVKENL